MPNLTEFLLNPKEPGHLGGVFLEKQSLSFLNFHSNEDHNILYKIRDDQLAFDTLVNVFRF
jgi:hypothetical protein